MWNPYEDVPDDTTCAECGRKLPDAPEPGTPAWDGYCDERCRRHETGCNSLNQLADHLGICTRTCDDVPGAVTAWVSANTLCGASLDDRDDGVVLFIGEKQSWPNPGTLPHLTYPFHIDDFHAALRALDAEAARLVKSLARALSEAAAILFDEEDKWFEKHSAAVRVAERMFPR